LEVLPDKRLHRTQDKQQRQQHSYVGLCWTKEAAEQAGTLRFQCLLRGIVAQGLLATATRA
jgi:hypothetical protein